MVSKRPVSILRSKSFKEGAEMRALQRIKGPVQSPLPQLMTLHISKSITVRCRYRTPPENAAGGDEDHTLRVLLGRGHCGTQAGLLGLRLCAAPAGQPSPQRPRAASCCRVEAPAHDFRKRASSSSDLTRLGNAMGWRTMLGKDQSIRTELKRPGLQFC